MSQPEDHKRRKIRLTEGNAKCSHLKKVACKGILRQVFICPSPRTLYPPTPYTSVADPYPGSGIRDPGSGALLTPGSGIRNGFFPDRGSRIPNPYFLELSDNFLGKKFYNSLKICPCFFLQHFKYKIIFNFVRLVATKKV
jgi:hypothetical protein